MEKRGKITSWRGKPQKRSHKRKYSWGVLEKKEKKSKGRKKNDIRAFSFFFACFTFLFLFLFFPDVFFFFFPPVTQFFFMKTRETMFTQCPDNFFDFFRLHFPVSNYPCQKKMKEISVASVSFVSFFFLIRRQRGAIDFNQGLNGWEKKTTTIV